MVKLTDKDYVAQIYEDTYLYITKYLIIKCRYSDDVSDLLQNTYVKFLMLIKKRGQAHVLYPKHYLLRIAKEELFKYYRNKDAETEIRESFNEFDYKDENEKTDESFLLEEVSEDYIMSDLIWNEIKRMDELTIKIFQLRFMYDMKLPEISEDLKVSLSTVKNKLYRGLAKVKEIMDCDNSKLKGVKKL